MNNPFSNRAGEAMGGREIIEHGWLSELTDEADYNERLESLLLRGKLVLQTDADKECIQKGTWIRVSGDCRCLTCGRLYYDHPRLHQYAILHKICDGSVVKL